MATRPNRWLITLEEVKQSFVNIEAATTERDAKLGTLIRAASRFIETELGFTYFYPVTETRYFDHPVDTTKLNLDMWLLSVTTFTTEGGDTSLSAGDYYPTRNYGHNMLPYNLVVMDQHGDYPDLLWSDSLNKANAITGAWGYGNDTEDTGTTLAEDLDTSETAVDVTDGAAIKVGDTLLVGTEQMFVSAKPTTNTLTVERGDNGTTAATHDNLDSISRYYPPADIAAACGILVARLFHRGDTAWSDLVGPAEIGLRYMKPLPMEVERILNNYKLEWLGPQSGWVDWGELLDR